MSEEKLEKIINNFEKLFKQKNMGEGYYIIEEGDITYSKLLYYIDKCIELYGISHTNIKERGKCKQLLAKFIDCLNFSLTGKHTLGFIVKSLPVFETDPENLKCLVYNIHQSRGFLTTDLGKSDDNKVENVMTTLLKRLNEVMVKESISNYIDMCPDDVIKQRIALIQYMHYLYSELKLGCNDLIEKINKEEYRKRERTESSVSSVPTES